MSTYDHDAQRDTEREPWEVTDEDLMRLKEEQEVMGDADERATAERLFRENLPHAALSIIRLATNAGSDRTRLDAAKYVVERNLGRIQDLNTSGDDPLANLVKELSETSKELSNAD